MSQTTYTRDEQGQLVATTTWEPEWLEEDVAWARAYLQEKADRCPVCGLPMSETTAMAGGQAVHSYKAPLPIRCHACTALHKAQDAHAKQSGAHDPNLYWQVEQES